VQKAPEEISEEEAELDADGRDWERRADGDQCPKETE
jgi:hypothetical protein